MAEREFKILITGDASGINSASREGGQAMGEYSRLAVGANKEVAEEVKKTDGVHKLLHGSVKLLGHEFGALRGLAHYVFSPWTAALGAVLVAVRMVHAAHERLKQAAEEAGAANARSFIALTDAEQQSASKITEWVQSFRSEVDALEAAQAKAVTGNGKIVAAINAQKDALTKLAASRKEFELTQAKTDEERQEIELRYRRTGRVVNEGAEASIIGEKRKELAGAEAKQSSLTEATAAAAAAALGEPGQHRQKLIATYKDFQTDVQKQLDAASKEAELKKGTGGWAAAAKKVGIYEDELRQTAGRLEELQAQDADAKRRLDNAKKAELDNQKLIQDRRAELPGLQAQFHANQSTSVLQAAYEVGGTYNAQWDKVKTELPKAAAELDLPAFIQAITKLTALPVMMKQMTDVINGASAEADRAIGALDVRVGNLEGSQWMYRPTR